MASRATSAGFSRPQTAKRRPRKTFTDKECIVAGYNFLAQDPLSGAFIPGADGNPVSTLGREGVLTAYYGAPRQVFLSLGINF